MTRSTLRGWQTSTGLLVEFAVLGGGGGESSVGVSAPISIRMLLVVSGVVRGSERMAVLSKVVVLCVEVIGFVPNFAVSY